MWSKNKCHRRGRGQPWPLATRRAPRNDAFNGIKSDQSRCDAEIDTSNGSPLRRAKRTYYRGIVVNTVIQERDLVPTVPLRNRQDTTVGFELKIGGERGEEERRGKGMDYPGLPQSMPVRFPRSIQYLHQLVSVDFKFQSQSTQLTVCTGDRTPWGPLI
ncbi:hypothetical protein PYCCODRAFT_200370 [Trametes coccinea BRFM310]|uniref:Uncharacterized protein n=1 Tax=Trametes coccinea (strain BRFM310) TaxID=1353009 RepID=A0A1Y2IRN0_TRAC3|nr:hypothetical protein PYCCODRAFT_200370 [Trametes coccinea BRFM310]